MADSVHEILSAWGKKGGESRSAKKREAARRNIAKARASIGAPTPEPVAAQGQPPKCVTALTVKKEN
jgi:hypothetical protein